MNIDKTFKIKEKRDIQIVLDELWVEYSQLYQKINNLDYFIKTNSIKKEADDDLENAFKKYGPNLESVWK